MSPATSPCGPTCPAARSSTCSAASAAAWTPSAAPSCWTASTWTPGKQARTYSKGNRQKVALVAALAADVELLLLDEPTAGLDPLMEAAFCDWINAEERARGRTVLLSSHVLAEVEALCDRVSIVRAGRVVESGTLAELRHLTRTSVTAELASPPDGLLALEGVHDLVADGTRVRFQVDDQALDAALRRLTSLGCAA
jgi:ABC-2 type transport system ATP-binding protein